MHAIGWIFGLLLLLGGTAEAIAKPAITDVRLGVEPGLTRVVISLTEHSNYRVFTLADPYRVVIDMSEVDWKVPSGTKLQHQGLVAGMRYGLFKAGTSRVVFDLMEPSEVARAEFVPPDKGEPLRLLIDLRPVADTQFRAQANTSTIAYSAIAATASVTKPARTSSGAASGTGALGAGGSAAKQPTEEPKRGKTVEQLLKQLQEQAFLMNHLMRRVRELEQRVGMTTIAPRGAAKGNQNAVPVPVAANAPEQSAQQSPPVPPEVDEEAAERALERTLTAEGALLLPSGKSEIEPSFTYTRRENDNAALFLVNGSIVLGTREIERDEFTGGLDYRIGLPLDAQLELGIPYNVVSQSIVDDSGGLNETRTTGQGIGDPTIGIAKTLMRESGWRPDLIARVTYDSDLGKEVDNDVALGAGFHEIRGSLTALKRQDPLAFVGTLSYEKSFEQNDIEAGDEFGLSLSTLLAASPETSLRLGLQQAYSEDFEVDGHKVEGSDQLQASAIMGVSTILGRSVFLDVSAGIGLTEDAPDYFVGVSLPIRFDFPDR
jgi:hypothetical protein